MLAVAALALVVSAPAIAQQMPFTKAGTGQPPPPLPPAAAATPTNAAPLTPTNAAPLTATNAVQAGATNSAWGADLTAIKQFLDANIPGAIAKGKFDLNVRARLEEVHESGLSTIKSTSLAPTVRTRLGYTTAPLYGFQAAVQGQNTSVIGPEGNYNAASSNGKLSKPVIADPAVTDLDQAWLGYTYTNLFDVKGGRLRLDLDNQRFVGDVDWRQNMQTFDAAAAHVRPIEHLDLTYNYIWDVHRVYGNVDGLPPANRDYDSDSHLVNLSYSGWDYGRFVGYAYLLSLTNAANAINSCATYGGYFAGAAPVCNELSLDYRAEFAWQEDYGHSKLRYSADYANLEAGASYQRFAAGAGWEDLGSGLNTGAGGGRAAFRTPLATLHSFDGWAEMFLNAPANGLHDLYAYAQVTAPAQVPVRFVYHKFDADYGSGDFGQEFDVIATKNFGKHWQLLLEYACYDGANAAPPAISAAHVDLQRFWVHLQFTF